MGSSPLDYYATAGPMTDPGPHAAALDDLPRDLAGLIRAVQGLTIHIFWAERYGVQLPDERKQEVQIRPVGHKLARLLELDGRPLCESRPLERRLVGNCRDISTLLCAILRRQGTPARARSGFGTYFLPDHFEDHWVCEYYHAGQGRWVMVDAQLDALQQQALGIDFDPLDVPPDRFIVAGRAWQMCRAGQADPDRFGIFEYHGLGFVRGNVVRDLLALNKIEILPWDMWGIMLTDDERLAPEEWALFDRIAALTLGGDAAWGEVRAVYDGDPRLHIPADWPV